MKEIAENILRKMVDKPDGLVVEENTTANHIELKVQADKDDIGKIIGKKGQNIQALRTLLQAMCAKNHRKNLLLELIED